MLPNSFSRGVAEYPFCTLVPTRDDAIEILANDGIIRGGHNGSQQTRYFFWLLRVAHIVGCLWSQIPDNVLALSAKVPSLFKRSAFLTSPLVVSARGFHFHASDSSRRSPIQ